MAEKKKKKKSKKKKSKDVTSKEVSKAEVKQEPEIDIDTTDKQSEEGKSEDQTGKSTTDDEDKSAATSVPSRASSLPNDGPLGVSSGNESVKTSTETESIQSTKKIDNSDPVCSTVIVNENQIAKNPEETKVQPKSPPEQQYDPEDENLLCLCRCCGCCVFSCLKSISKIHNEK